MMVEREKTEEEREKERDGEKGKRTLYIHVVTTYM